jgi:MFS family permease
MLGIFFPMTIFLQGIRGMSPIEAGLTMTPMSLMIMVAAPIAGRLTDRIGARWILVTGLTLMTVGILLITSRIDLETNWQRLLPALLITGTGMGLTFAPMTAAAMASVPPRIAGSASGIINTMRNVGQVLGIAVLGSLLQSQVGARTADALESLPLDQATRDRVVGLAEESRFEQIGAVAGDAAGAVYHAVQQAFADSIQYTFFAGALACAVALALAFLVRNPAPRPAERPVGDTFGQAEALTAPIQAAAD